MKSKSDFVTNSSSASFILYLTSTIYDLEKFGAFFRNHIYKGSSFGAGSKYSYSYPTICEVSNGVYKIEEFTSMFNGFEDIPSWMIDLIIRQTLINDNCEYKLPSEISGVKFEIESHN